MVLSALQLFIPPSPNYLAASIGPPIFAMALNVGRDGGVLGRVRVSWLDFWNSFQTHCCPSGGEAVRHLAIFGRCPRTQQEEAATCWVGPGNTSWHERLGQPDKFLVSVSSVPDGVLQNACRALRQAPCAPICGAEALACRGCSLPAIGGFASSTDSDCSWGLGRRFVGR